jgi:hypothetical protein
LVDLADAFNATRSLDASRFMVEVGFKPTRGNLKCSGLAFAQRFHQVGGDLNQPTGGPQPLPSWRSGQELRVRDALAAVE